MKKYILIAGVNGAGKSTLYQTLHSLHEMLRVNTDEIVKEFGDWRNVEDQIKAGKIAVSKLKEYIANDVSFNQETTLCGKSVLGNIRKAKEKGYVIELHYVGVDSADIAKERVKFRVEHGGHGIPEEIIEKRYNESLKNLQKVLPLCDLVMLYDNTESFRRFAIYRRGTPARISHSVPLWYSNLIEEKKSRVIQ